VYSALPIFALVRAAASVLLAPRPIENLGSRHTGRIDTDLLKRRLGAREMSFGYDGETWRKIL
jgi:hypothetical protein